MCTAPTFTPPNHTIFGDLYIQEKHRCAADRQLPPSDIGKVIGCLKASMFKEVMKSLRSALYTG